MRKMKDSGILWIGDVPINWELNKIGNFYEERNIKVSSREYKPLSVTKQGIVPQLETAAKSDNEDNRKLIKINDFVINSRSDRKGSCGISEYNGSCSLINIVLKPRKTVCNAYYGFVFKSELFADEFYRWGNGIVDDLWSTKWSSMKKIYIPSPPINEQHRIADYLDNKCEKIDDIIKKQKEIIDKLKEYKMSLITEAVTKGLNPDAPMKDSGIEWIGRMPSDWKIVQLKRLCVANNGKEIDREVSVNNKEAVGVFGSGGVFKYTDAYLYNGESVLFGRKGTLGKPIYVNQKFWAVDTMYYLVYYSQIIAKFNYYQLCAFDWMPYITQTALPSVVASQILLNKFAIPTLAQQKEIARYLDKKCAQIDDIIKKKKALIEKLTEYKKSLIYELVTGKKEI